MTIYIDSEFKCYASPGEGRRAVELSQDAAAFFEGKCTGFIEGYRYIPDGLQWLNPKGAAFQGEMISPWKDSRELARLQAAYEHELLQAGLAGG